MGITVSERARNYVRGRVEDHMLATISIFRPVEGSFNDSTGIVSIPSRTEFYSGKARIRLLSSGSEIVIGESEIAMADTVISIPHDSPRPKAEDIAVVSDNPPSTILNGYAFTVVNFTVGGLIGASIEMNCRALDDNSSWKNV